MQMGDKVVRYGQRAAVLLLSVVVVVLMCGCQTANGSGSGFGAGARAYDMVGTFPPTMESQVAVLDRPYDGTGQKIGRINGWDNAFIGSTSIDAVFNIMRTEAARVGAHTVYVERKSSNAFTNYSSADGVLVRLPGQ